MTDNGDRRGIDTDMEDVLRQKLQGMPQPLPPADLRTQLRVLASREAARRRTRATYTAMFGSWKAETQLRVNNLMRPLAIPTAGGFVSALLSFLVLANGVMGPGPSVVLAKDVPTGLYTEASVKYIPLAFHEQEFLVEITVDDQGKMVDYTLPNSDMDSPTLRRDIEKRLLFTLFTPATSFGQPTSGKVRILFKNNKIDESNKIDVRG